MLSEITAERLEGSEMSLIYLPGSVARAVDRMAAVVAAATAGVGAEFNRWRRDGRGQRVVTTECVSLRRRDTTAVRHR